MTASIGMVTFDCADAAALARWWAERLDGKIVFETEYFLVVAPGQSAGLNLGFQTVPDPTPGKNRLHLDLGAADAAAEVARFQAAGATFVATQEMPGLSWTVLADPEGNQFCIAAGEEPN